MSVNVEGGSGGIFPTLCVKFCRVLLVYAFIKLIVTCITRLIWTLTSEKGRQN